MELKDIMTENIVSVERDDSLKQAAELMRKYNIGSIPVCEADRIVGIITDRDVVTRGIAEDNELYGVKCNDVMSSDLTLGNINMDVHDAARIMAEKKIRRLPVVDNGRLVGIVSLGDLAVEPKLVNEAGSALNDISKPLK